jgi:Protein of unknown function (DUF2892).
MSKKSFVRAIAGTVITAGFLGGWFINQYIYLVTLFAGLNLLQSSYTGFCPPEKIYDRYLSE